MPSWCEGNIRVRGLFPKVVKFFSDNLVAIKRTSERDHVPVSVKNDGDYCVVFYKPKLAIQCEDSFYFDKSDRQFIETEAFYIEDDSDEDLCPEIVACVEGFRGAWNIDAKYFLSKAVEYGIDIKIWGFNRGTEFAEIVECKRDGSCSDKVERYNNWDWDCPRPNLGG